MELAVDLGNTVAKCGFFENDKLIKKETANGWNELVNITNDHLPDHLILSSVKEDAERIIEKFDSRINCLVFNADTQLPIINKYETKATLGLDRLAAVVGAQSIFPERNCLSIDIGTCITYDLITSEGAFLGGAISPGIDIKLKSMNHYTARLPLIEVRDFDELIGTSTETSLLSGVINGTKAEIMQMIRLFESKFADLQIIICGGNSKFVADFTLSNVTFLPDLVLLGLNRILKNHVKSI